MTINVNVRTDVFEVDVKEAAVEVKGGTVFGGLPTGGSNQDVLLKAGASDWDVAWTSTIPITSVAPGVTLTSDDTFFVIQSGGEVPGLITAASARSWIIAGTSASAAGPAGGVLDGEYPDPTFSSQAAASLEYASTTVSGQLSDLITDVAAVSSAKPNLDGANTFTAANTFSGATTTFTSGVVIDDDDGDAVLTLDAATAASVGVSHGDNAQVYFKQAGTSLWRITAGTFLGVTNLFGIEDLLHSREGVLGVTGGAAGSAFTQLLDRLIVKRGTSGQTANLQEWQDHNGGVLAFVTASGRISAVAPSADSHLTTLGAARTDHRQEPSVKTAGYSLVSGDVNRTIVMSNGAGRTFTIGSEVSWRSGDYFRLVRRGGSHTIAASGATVLEASAGTSASVGFAANGGVITCEHLGSHRWILYGDVA